MILPEYYYRMKAHHLTCVDKEHDFHLQAWLGQQVGATKEQGDKNIPVYKTFEQFFDYKKAVEAITGPATKKVNNQHKRMAQVAARLNSKT